MSHPFDVVGYTADADTYCVADAKKKYGDDNNGANPVYDNEGNEVHPIFADEEFWEPQYCIMCLEELDVKVLDY